MKQENYKAIAEINKRNKKWFANDEVHALYCEQQADYFEKEEKHRWDYFKNIAKKDVEYQRFIREQFLEWCGVK